MRDVLRIVLAPLLVVVFSTPAAAAITFLGAASAPADYGSQIGPTVTVIPPTAMQAGDLAVVFVQYRDGVAGEEVPTILPTEYAGQAWSFVVQANDANVRLRVFWCRFNGTWLANPSFSSTDSIGTPTGTLPLTAVMVVFRPSDMTKWWIPNIYPITGNFVAGSSPFTKTITGVTTSKESTVSIAAWATADANTWGNLAGEGWQKTGLSAQYRNSSGSRQSSSYAYQIQISAGATNDVSQDQVTLGGDPGSTYMMAFAEIDLPSGGSGADLAYVQSQRFQDELGGDHISATFNSPVGPNRAVVGFVHWEAGENARLANITDDQGNEYIIVQSVSDNSLTQGFVSFFLPDITNAPITVTANFTIPTSYTGIIVHEVSGAVALDQHNGRYRPPVDESPATVTAGPVTTTADGVYIFGAILTGDHPIPYPDFPAWGGIKREEGTGGEGTGVLASADNIQTIAGPIEVTAFLDPDANTYFVMMALKPLGGASVPKRPHRGDRR